MSAPTCAECAHGAITEHSSRDKCANALNVSGYHPFALRHDATLCGPAAAWFTKKADADPVYKAAAAVGRSL